jgi:hypothetical protein
MHYATSSKGGFAQQVQKIQFRQAVTIGTTEFQFHQAAEGTGAAEKKGRKTAS